MRPLDGWFFVEDRSVSNGRLHFHAARQGIIELNESLALDLVAVHDKVSDEEVVQEISRVYTRWCHEYFPLDAEGMIDGTILEQKLRNGLTEVKRQIREELKRKNVDWVSNGVQSLID